jgi:hypothetical protein
VNDEVFEGYRITTYRSGTTTRTSTSGTCKNAAEPTSSYSSAQAGVSASVTQYADLRGHHFRFDVWINPLPSQGTCYSRLYVKGGYTHKWSSQGLTWSLGYPWGVGAGVVSSDSDFTAGQDTDRYADADLITGKLCHH